MTSAAFARTINLYGKAIFQIRPDCKKANKQHWWHENSQLAVGQRRTSVLQPNS